MIGTIVKQDNQLMIRVVDPMYGKLYLLPDVETRGMVEARNLCDQVEGYIVKAKFTTESGINVNAWHFHIESFED